MGKPGKHDLFPQSAPPGVWREALAGLTKLEQEVAALRLGATGAAPQTVAETARRLDISRERVRRTEAKALARLDRILQDEE